MITIDLSEIVGLITSNKIEDLIADQVQDIMTAIYVDLQAPPPLGTPVDTGVARNGWQLDTSKPLEPEITNNVPYIGALNNGHSGQSPEGFVEAVVDSHTR